MSSSSAMVRILIKGGKVVNDDCTQEADVYIENGIIQQVGKELMIPGGAKVIDASGKLVLPGGIDTSVHLEESFMNATTADDYYSGTKVRKTDCPYCRERQNFMPKHVFLSEHKIRFLTGVFFKLNLAFRLS